MPTTPKISAAAPSAEEEIMGYLDAATFDAKNLLTRFRQEVEREAAARELKILEAHIDQQIYQKAVNTGSLLQYIDDRLAALYPEKL